MARVLFTSSRQAGLVIPLAQIAGAAVAAGHEVWFLSGDAFRDVIEASGATYVQVSYDTERPAPVAAPVIRSASGVGQIAATLRSLVIEPTEPEFVQVGAVSAELGIDVVVTEQLFVGSLMLALRPRAERPAVLAVGLFPVMLSSADTAPYGLGIPPLDSPLNGPRNALLRFVTGHLLLGGLTRETRALAERLTGRRPKGALLDLGLAADEVAQLTVPQFEYPRRNAPSHLRFVGPLPPPAIGDLPDWWDYADRRPVVYVTQGTYANADFTSLLVPAIRALADAPVRVVCTTGGPDPAEVERAYGGPLPANAHVTRLLPYHQLMPEAAVVVTSGGYGTVHHALRWGVPVIVTGVTEDKVEVGARVTWSGVGLELRERHPSPAAIRLAVDRVLTHPSHQFAARRIAAAIADTDALRDIVSMIGTLAEPAPAEMA